MGLFSTKFCDICGGKIGLLGNRKLEDGNLCKDCANKLSPFFSERRKSTIDDIKKQLAYREANKAAVAAFQPTRTLGTSKKVYIDERNGKFLVNSSRRMDEGNPDVIELSQVTACKVDIDERRNEVKWKDQEGKQVSYNPPRFTYDYDFTVVINVRSPWFDEIRVRVNNSTITVEPPINQYQMYGGQQQKIGQMSQEYRECEAIAEEIRFALTNRGQFPGQPMQGGQYPPQQQQPQMPGVYPPPPPYGQQPPMQGNPYGQQPMQGNPYGQQPPMQGNPYGQQPPMQGNPYGQQPPMQGNPYGQQPPMQGNPYGQQPPMQANYGAPAGYPPQQAQAQPVSCPQCKSITMPDAMGRCQYCGGALMA